MPDWLFSSEISRFWPFSNRLADEFYVFFLFWLIFGFSANWIVGYFSFNLRKYNLERNIKLHTLILQNMTNDQCYNDQ